jgi:2-(1,2-epoxy-1,2-dihydrophenyl)acetyl-CoA isomerase
MTERELLFSNEKGIFTITLNRPEVKNAISPRQRNKLIEVLETASGHAGTRCIVLRGNGGSFCSGADLRAQSDPPTTVQELGLSSKPKDAPERIQGDVSRVLATGAQRLISAVMDCEKPVIAAVEGVAAGIGAHLAFACDLVIATETARFIEIFVRRGLVPDGAGAYLLVRLVGPQKAKELVFFGGDVHAQDACEMGLVNRVVPADQLDATVQEWAELLALGPTRTIALAKRLINNAHDIDRATALAQEAWAQEMNLSTHDGQEGVKAFVEKRDPEFKGW